MIYREKDEHAGETSRHRDHQPAHDSHAEDPEQPPLRLVDQPHGEGGEAHGHRSNEDLDQAVGPDPHRHEQHLGAPNPHHRGHQSPAQNRHHAPEPHHRHPHNKKAHAHAARRGDQLVDAIQLLVDMGQIDSFAALIAAADRLHRPSQPNVAAYIREECDPELPLELAVDQVRHFVHASAAKAHSAVLRELRNLRVAVIHPVPPHVVEILVELAEVVVLLPEDDHVPPHLRHSGLRLSKGFRRCQREIVTAEAIVIEADNAVGGRFLVGEVIADLLDSRLVPPHSLLAVHLHPHHRHHPSHHHHQAVEIQFPDERVRFI